jgi:hypothetical protein
MQAFQLTTKLIDSGNTPEPDRRLHMQESAGQLMQKTSTCHSSSSSSSSSYYYYYYKRPGHKTDNLPLTTAEVKET